MIKNNRLQNNLYGKRFSVGKAEIVSVILSIGLSGCTTAPSYQTSKTLDGVFGSIPSMRGFSGLITLPMKMAQEEESRRKAEEEKLRRQAEEQRRQAEAQRKQAEYDRWFNSLTREQQVQIVAEQEKTRREAQQQQSEMTNNTLRAIGNMLEPDVYIVK